MQTRGTLIALVALGLTLSGCASSGMTETTASMLSAGMTRDQVVKIMGQPQGFITERGGVECLSYADRNSSLVPMAMTVARDRVVILKDGNLIGQQLADAGAAPGVSLQMAGRPPVLNTVCAQAAAKFAQG